MVGFSFRVDIGLIVGDALVGAMGGVAFWDICHGMDGMLEVRRQTVVSWAGRMVLFSWERFDFLLPYVVSTAFCSKEAVFNGVVR